MKIDHIYSKLSLANDFIFMKVMQNEHLCKKLLELILDIQIEKLEFIEHQKNIDISLSSHGIRLDIYVKDSKKTIYNVEMQTVNTKELPARSRYYQSVIDINLIEKGQSYKELSKSYIIFICTFDIFGYGRHIYTFENLCLQDPHLHLNDGSTKIFLNPYSDMDDIHSELKNFLTYLSDELITDSFTEDLSEAVNKAKNNEEWRREYMTLYMKEQEARESGREEGRINTLLSLIQKGILSESQAAQELGVSVEDFRLKAEQFNTPENNN